MSTTKISINRAPLLTLWAAVVAQRLGFGEEEALTLGQAVAGLNAHSKGRRLGLIKPEEGHAEKAKEEKPGHRRVRLLGRAIPVKETRQGVRAVLGGEAVRPSSVR